MNVGIRSFRLEDTNTLTKWGKYSDPRLLHYNFPYSKKSDLKSWYNAKSKFMKRWIYAIVVDETKVVGYITLKNVNWLLLSGEMGIVINPDYVGNGIGKLAINKYLKHIFSHFPLSDIFLRVASFNYRARRCYKSCGFIISDKKYIEYEEQENMAQIIDKFEYFKQLDGVLYAEYLYMRFNRKFQYK